MIPAGKTCRGFTLIEILAATAMTAVLAGSLYASLSIAFRARDTAVKSLTATRTCETAVALVRNDLQSAVGTSGTLAGAFTGTSGSGIGTLTAQGCDLTFCAVASDAEIQPDSGVADIQQVEFFCENTGDPDNMSLIRRVTTNLLSPVTPTTKDQTLCRNVKAFALRYFNGTTWQDSWDSSAMGNILPMAVEVTLELNAPGYSSVPGTGYKLSRVVRIPCGQPYAGESSSGSSSTGGGTSTR